MENNIEETITISKEEYNKLKRDQRKLNVLECGGVDNWEWYDEAMRAFDDDNNDE